MPIELRSHLAKLGSRSVGTFLRLPPSGLLERFGPAAHRLHLLASGRCERPLEPRPIADPVEARTLLDQPVASTLPLLAVIQRLLAPLLEGLAGREQAAAALHVLFTLDNREHWIETLRPAAPTLDAKILLDLTELRLHGDRLPAGVIEIGLCLEVAAADREQLRLFAAASRRDLRAAARALARLRAEFGEEAVVCAKLREGHLPEARFAWEPAGKVERACPRRIRVRPLVRRIRVRPQPLPSRPASERLDNWLLQDPQMGAVTRTLGPYLVSGGWWVQAVHREYYFVETSRGDLLWLFYDRRRRCWQLQGRVE